MEVSSVKMKYALALVVLAVVARAVPQGTGKIDNYSVQQILSDDKLYQQYFNCVMDKGPCTPGGQNIKDHIPDHVNGGCANCPPERKERAKVLVKFMIANKAQDFEQFEKKHDPKQNLRKLYGQ